MTMNKGYDICIVGGCGHVGLPLGLAFANRAQRVILYDTNQKAVDKVNKKEMPFLERGSREVLLKVVDSQLLFASTDITVISQAPHIILTTATPVDEHLNPRVHDIMDVVKHMLPFLRDEQLIILRSTLYPGTSQILYNYLRSQGKKSGVAYCPERTAQGFVLEELGSLPQIVSGFDPKAVEKAKKLFTILTQDIVELSPIEAELAKLFTNTWRYINFAISNQFYMIANSYGLDFYKIYNGMVKNYPRLQGFARAGFAAGPCLFKDTIQLSAFTNNRFFLGHVAMLINEGLPIFIVEQLKSKLPLKEKIVGILGMAFKADNDDPRESLSYKLKKILEVEAKEVICSDVYISEPGFVNPEVLIDRADIIIVGAPHREYKSLDLKNKYFVDIWNFFGKGGKIV